MVQTKLRHRKGSWFARKADEIQSYADRYDSKKFFDALKAFYCPQSSGSSSLLSADGTTLITDKAKILERWSEHFEAVLNRPSTINDEAINRLDLVEINHAMGHPPEEQEVEKAILQLASGKAPGTDDIPAEIYKAGGPIIIKKVTKLLCLFWKRRLIPQELKDASIHHMFKRKGHRNACDNHRGISLLVVVGKILARVMLMRLNCYLEQGLYPESQCGFKQDRGTVDMIFAARQLQEKCL